MMHSALVLSVCLALLALCEADFQGGSSAAASASASSGGAPSYSHPGHSYGPSHVAHHRPGFPRRHTHYGAAPGAATATASAIAGGPSHTGYAAPAYNVVPPPPRRRSFHLPSGLVKKSFRRNRKPHQPGYLPTDVNPPYAYPVGTPRHLHNNHHAYGIPEEEFEYEPVYHNHHPSVGTSAAAAASSSSGYHHRPYSTGYNHATGTFRSDGTGLEESSYTRATDNVENHEHGHEAGNHYYNANSYGKSLDKSKHTAYNSKDEDIEHTPHLYRKKKSSVNYVSDSNKSKSESGSGVLAKDKHNSGYAKNSRRFVENVDQSNKRRGDGLVENAAFASAVGVDDDDEEYYDSDGHGTFRAPAPVSYGTGTAASSSAAAGNGAATSSAAVAGH